MQLTLSVTIGKAGLTLSKRLGHQCATLADNNLDLYPHLHSILPWWGFPHLILDLFLPERPDLLFEAWFTGSMRPRIPDHHLPTERRRSTISKTHSTFDGLLRGLSIRTVPSLFGGAQAQAKVSGSL